MTTPIIKKCAVLGSGVMGAQIAALLAQCGLYVYLFDLFNPVGDPNKLANDAIAHLAKIQPSPLYSSTQKLPIISANFDTDLSYLSECGLIVEAITERIDWKKNLYEKITPYLTSETILATNTSGLSIDHLADFLPVDKRHLFLGMHFFNPPRYMHLVELIPSIFTHTSVLEYLEEFATSRLGKGVIVAKDTPNFIANRVGVFALLVAIHHAERFNIPPDKVDYLTGPLIGRSRSASFRTMDVVGLDTIGHVVRTMKEQLIDDPWQSFYKLPQWLENLVAKGHLGQKTGQGIYKKENDQILVIDSHTMSYRPAQQKNQSTLTAANFFTEQSKEAQFLQAIHLELFLYSAFHGSTIAHNPWDIDKAMMWGYGWNEGPFTTWQNFGWHPIIQHIEKMRQSNILVENVSLPSWVHSLHQGPYVDNKYWCFQENDLIAPVLKKSYKKQLVPLLLPTQKFSFGETLFETEAVIFREIEEVGVLSFKTKMNTISQAVLDGILKALDYAEKKLTAFVLWQENENFFSVGADLKELLSLLNDENFIGVDAALCKFQQTALRLRDSNIPTIAAVQGYVWGGACELMMHCDITVATQESYIGLIEPSAGIIPAASGTTEMTHRAQIFCTSEQESQAKIEQYFWQIATGYVSKSALNAKEIGYLRVQDKIISHPKELLYSAIQLGRGLNPSYQPSLLPYTTLHGNKVISKIKEELAGLYEQKLASEHDIYIGNSLIEIMCNSSEGGIVSEKELLERERHAFIALVKTAKTQERIRYLLENGKPLKN